MTLRHRIQAMSTVLAALVIVNFVVDRLLVSERNEYRDDVRTMWQPARDRANELQFALVDQQASAREYVITRDEAFLDAYDDAARRADAALADLDAAVGDGSSVAPFVDRVAGRVSASRQLGAEYEIAAVREGRTEEAVDLVATGTSKRLFDEARVEIEELRDAIFRELERREARVQRIEMWIGAFRFLSALAAAVAVAVSVVGLSRWLARPLREIVDATRVVAAGSLDHQIPLAGPPELRELGADVEAMRRRIRDEIDEAARARSSLAQRGMVILALREELAPPAQPEPPQGLAVAVGFRPAETLIAGDWYELRRSSPSTYTFAIADVSGHGQAAGIFALRTKQMVQIALHEGYGPAETWAWLSAHLRDTDEQFLSGVIGVVDVERETLTYASAGHPPLLKVGAALATLPPTGPVIGAFAGTWHDATEPFVAGETVVAYSDGLLEVRAADGVWADFDALASDLLERRGDAPSAIVDECLAFHDRHNDATHRDDITVVAIGAAARVLPDDAVGGFGHRLIHGRAHS